MTGTRRALTRCLLAATLAASLGGCGEDQEPVTLPSLTPSTATPTSTVGLTDEEQIRAIYTDYVANWPDAQDLPASERRHYLGEWTIDPQRAAIVEILADNEKKHLRLEGKSVPHIFKIDIDGDKAVINDCSDDRKAIIKNTKTGKVQKFDRSWYVVELKKQDYGWRVRQTDMRSKSCVGR